MLSDSPEAAVRNHSQFLLLPHELTLQILELLPSESLKQLCLVNNQAYDLAVGLLWKEVRLVDCRGTPDGIAAHSEESPDDHESLWVPDCDLHCDAPIISKLFVLAR